MSGSSEANSTEECLEQPKDKEVAVGLLLGSASLSFVACIVVVAIVCTLKKYHALSQRLILYLSIAVVIRCLVWTSHFVEYELVLHCGPSEMTDRVCSAVAYFTLTAGWMEIVAVTCLTTHLLLNTVTEERRKWTELAYLLAIFILPFTFTWLPFTGGAYGRRGQLCWIKTYRDSVPSSVGIVIHILVWFLPLAIVITYLVVLYIRVAKTVKKKNTKWDGNVNATLQRSKVKAQQDVRRLFWYPFAYFSFCLIPIALRLAYLASSEPVYPLWILASIAWPLQGGVIAVAFVLDVNTLRRLRRQTIPGAVRGFVSAQSVKDYPTSRQLEEQSYGDMSGSWNNSRACETERGGSAEESRIRGQYTEYATADT